MHTEYEQDSGQGAKGARAVREHGDARSATASAPKGLPELYVLVTRKEDDINVAKQAKKHETFCPRKGQKNAAPVVTPRETPAYRNLLLRKMAIYDNSIEFKLLRLEGSRKKPIGA